MCGGGGGATVDPTYQANIDRDRAAQERQAEQTRADTAIARADAEKAGLRTTFDTGVANAETNSRAAINAYLSSRGLTGDEGTVNRVASNIRAQIPDLDPNPQKYFTDEAYSREFDTVAQGTRDRLGNQVNTQFAPGFERTLISDTADDPYLAAILGEQRGTASKVLDFNKARGLLNDTGYQTALNTLNTQGSAAQSTLTGIGDSVLGKSRQGLMDIRGEAGQAASGYRYGQAAPDIGSYYNRAATRAGTDLAGLEGSIRGAVGSTNFFDAPTALQTGGTMQGPINLTTRPAGVLGPVDETKRNQRGLGSTGVF